MSLRMCRLSYVYSQNIRILFYNHTINCNEETNKTRILRILVHIFVGHLMELENIRERLQPGFSHFMFSLLISGHAHSKKESFPMNSSNRIT